MHIYKGHLYNSASSIMMHCHIAVMCMVTACHAIIMLICSMIYTCVHTYSYMQVFSVLAAVCAAVAMSRLDFSSFAEEQVHARFTGQKLSFDASTIICCALLLSTCVGVTIREIVLLVLSLSRHPCSNSVFLTIVS